MEQASPHKSRKFSALHLPRDPARLLGRASSPASSQGKATAGSPRFKRKVSALSLARDSTPFREALREEKEQSGAEKAIQLTSIAVDADGDEGQDTSLSGQPAGVLTRAARALTLNDLFANQGSDRREQSERVSAAPRDPSEIREKVLLALEHKRGAVDYDISCARCWTRMTCFFFIAFLSLLIPLGYLQLNNIEIRIVLPKDVETLVVPKFCTAMTFDRASAYYGEEAMSDDYVAIIKLGGIHVPVAGSESNNITIGCTGYGLGTECGGVTWQLWTKLSQRTEELYSIHLEPLFASIGRTFGSTGMQEDASAAKYKRMQERWYNSYVLNGTNSSRAMLAILADRDNVFGCSIAVMVGKKRPTLPPLALEFAGNMQMQIAQTPQSAEDGLRLHGLRIRSNTGQRTSVSLKAIQIIDKTLDIFLPHGGPVRLEDVKVVTAFNTSGVSVWTLDFLASFASLPPFLPLPSLFYPPLPLFFSLFALFPLSPPFFTPRNVALVCEDFAF